MQLKIGFTGTGAITSIHLRNLSRMRDVRVLVVYGVVQEKARKIALVTNKSIELEKKYILKKLEDKTI